MSKKQYIWYGPDLKLFLDFVEEQLLSRESGDILPEKKCQQLERAYVQACKVDAFRRVEISLVEKPVEMGVPEESHDRLFELMSRRIVELKRNICDCCIFRDSDSPQCKAFTIKDLTMLTAVCSNKTTSSRELG